MGLFMSMSWPKTLLVKKQYRHVFVSSIIPTKMNITYDNSDGDSMFDITNNKTSALMDNVMLELSKDSPNMDTIKHTLNKLDQLVNPLDIGYRKWSNQLNLVKGIYAVLLKENPEQYFSKCEHPMKNIYVVKYRLSMLNKITNYTEYMSELNNITSIVNSIASRGDKLFYMAECLHLQKPTSTNNDTYKLFLYEATKHDHPEALYKMGIIMYREEDDIEKALLFLHRAHLLGKEKAGKLLDLIQNKLNSHVNNILHKLIFDAEMGNNQSQYELGKLYLKGEVSHRDKQKSIYWLKKAALNGNIHAQLDLGKIFCYLGMRDKKYYKKAFFWFGKASVHHTVPALDLVKGEAQYNVGLMLSKGLGVPQNIKQGIIWMHKSKDNGYTPAIKYLDEKHETSNKSDDELFQQLTENFVRELEDLNTADSSISDY